ncbi:MAG: threonine--tRNA ligase [Chloroflexi bacterium]|nr:MAG: threonine--tRNA ligase [Chloroflexota bacterium]
MIAAVASDDIQIDASDPHEQELARMRHSAAHVMAEAVQEMFPGAKFAIGPAIENGFYYDFDLPRPLTPDDLSAIEERMHEHVAAAEPFLRAEVSRASALEIFADQPYKLEIINDLPEDAPISTYRQGSFLDLCRGPHVEDTSRIGAFKLLNVAGAYWRGDENRPMLQRVYGTSWPTQKELEDYLYRLEEARKRDHRRIGRELGLFTFSEDVGPGIPLFFPKGEMVRHLMESYVRETQTRYGYQHVWTGHLVKEDLYRRSGHLEHYSDVMFPVMEDEEQRFRLKPMNCPSHMTLFNAQLHSYRELPLRFAEFATLYRYEKSGELFGLMRVRSMQMNDAHIYCTEEQFEQEFMAVIDLYRYYFEVFAIDKFVMRLSTHHRKGLGKKYIDNERLWLKTEEMVRRAMDNGGVPYVEAPDEAAFYGPKIDVQIWSAIGREFTLATNQVDFAVPARFDLVYTNREGKEETPLCIHRAPLSTHERMIGFLIEHFAGAFPVWLAPQQVRVIPITNDHNGYAAQLAQQLQAAGVRAEADLSSERMNAKIRDAQLMKTPYMLVVGDQEMANNTVSLRKRNGERVNSMDVGAFHALIKEKIESRALTL